MPEQSPMSEEFYYIFDEDRIPKPYSPWLQGFLGNTHFKEWTDFSERVTNVQNRVAELIQKCPKQYHLERRCLDASSCVRTFHIPSCLSHAYSFVTDVIGTFLRRFTGLSDLFFLDKFRFNLDAQQVWRCMCLRALSGKPPEQHRAMRRQRVSEVSLMMGVPLGNILCKAVCGFDYQLPYIDILAFNPCFMTTAAKAHFYKHYGEIEDLPEPNISAEEMSALYNRLFAKDLSNSPSQNQCSGLTCETHHAVAEALTHALSVGSGCMFLYNDKVGVAIELIKDTGQDKIQFRVSRAFNRKEAIMGMIALCMHALERVEDDEGLFGYVEDCAERIIRATRQAEDDMDHSKCDGKSKCDHFSKHKEEVDANMRMCSENKDKKDVPNSETVDTDSDNTNSSSDARTEVHHESTGGAGPRVVNHAALEASLDASIQNGKEADKSSDPGFHQAQNVFTNSAQECRKEMPAVDVSEEAGKKSSISPLAFNVNCQFELGIREARRLELLDIIGRGNSGVVYAAFWRGKKVAVKEWNGLDKKGKRLMLREVSFFRMIRKKYPSLLGEVFPNVLLAWIAERTCHNGANEPVLVMDYVGVDIVRQNDVLCMWNDQTRCYEKVNADVELSICNAAVQGLKKLHAIGRTHGSINLRNIRVQRENTSDGSKGSSDSSWRVWWIDIGRTEEISRPGDYFIDDFEECYSLFHTRTKAADSN